jgi:hypothetical protein
VSPVTRAPRLQQTTDVVARTIADETFLLPIKGELVNTTEMFVLSEVGLFIWDLVDGHRGLEEMVAAVVEAFEVDETRARADVHDFLDELARQGLVREVS